VALAVELELPVASLAPSFAGLDEHASPANPRVTAEQRKSQIAGMVERG
jgi:hypothetical protein